MAEAFVATFKTELLAGRRFPSFASAERETVRWIGFYNRERLHEELGDVPPAEFERNFYLAAGADAQRDDLRPSADSGNVLLPRNPGPCGPAEDDRPALLEGAPAGLGGTEHAT
jgi:putative transposase